MQSLIIPGIVLFILALWGVWESGRKFRREFQRRGKLWEEVCAALQRGEGMLVVDSIWGPQRGLGHPTIWWMPRLGEGEELSAMLETESGSARLVRCPRNLKNMDALVGRFGAQCVRAHSWNIAPSATSVLPVASQAQ